MIDAMGPHRPQVSWQLWLWGEGSRGRAWLVPAVLLGDSCWGHLPVPTWAMGVWILRSLHTTGPLEGTGCSIGGVKIRGWDLWLAEWCGGRCAHEQDLLESSLLCPSPRQMETCPLCTLGGDPGPMSSCVAWVQHNLTFWDGYFYCSLVTLGFTFITPWALPIYTDVSQKMMRKWVFHDNSLLHAALWVLVFPC